MTEGGKVVVWRKVDSSNQLVNLVSYGGCYGSQETKLMPLY